MASDMQVPSDWRYASLGELQDEGIISEIQDGNHGEKHPKSTDYVPIGIPFVMAKDLSGGRLNLNDCSFISRPLADSLRIGFARPGDVLLTHKATMGRVGIVPDGLEYVMLTPQVTYYRIGDPKRLSNVYLKYAFLGPDFQHQLNSDSDQSTRKYIGITAQRRLRVPLAPPREQRAIARMIGTLDDKIELNRRMNETLETIATALFKSWFVDFDAVRAKIEGHNLGVPVSITELFPDAFEGSELGEIPRGWITSSVYEIATFINGAAYRAFEPNQECKGLPIIKIAELKAGVTAQTRYSSVEMPEKYRINTRDILFSWSGNPDTSIDTFVWPHGPAWLNQHIFRVVPPSETARAFVLMTLRYLRPLFAEIARNKQTTGLGHVTSADLKRLLITRPPPSVLLSWNKIVEPMLERSFGLQLECNSLTALRDALLPKLISGQLRVKDAERQLEGTL